jgi:hypothetical protein
MARALFPKARHLSLSLGGSASAAAPKGASEEAEAVVIPLDEAEREPAPATPAGPQPSKPPKGGEQVGLPRALSVELAVPATPTEACADGKDQPLPIRCASSMRGRDHAAARATAAARLGEAVLLEGIDRWWRLGPDGAGYCDSCGHALVESLRESYGEHLLAFDALAGVRPGKDAPPVRERPYGGLREALRFDEAVDAIKDAALRARDEARSARQLELPVLGRADALSAVALASARHLDGLLFPLPSLDPSACLLALLAGRAALQQRPVIAVAPAAASAAQVAQLAALATACDVDLALAPGSPPEAEQALLAHRAFVSALRERLRPASPLADLVVLVSPRGEAITGGRHFATASMAAAAIARLHLQLDVALELPLPQRSPLLLAGVGALREDQAAAARRHVQDGGDVLQVGRCAVADDEGRSIEPLFAGVKAGLNRIGDGRVWAVAPDEDAAPDAQLEAQIARAARELLGRGRASLSLTGRGALLVRAYLDPERKLDVHFVNLDVRDAGPIAAQGLTLHLAGQIAGGGRAGYWFAPDREKGIDGERIALNPAGFGVSTVLPRIGASALLTVPR